MKLKKFYLFLAFIALSLLFFSFRQTEKNWQFYTQKNIGANNKLALYRNLSFDQENLYFNVQDGKTISLKQKSGEKNWQFQADKYSPFPTLIEGERIFLANFDGKVYSLDKQSGQQLWQFSVRDNSLPDTPIVTNKENDLLFFGSRTGTLYALYKNQGNLVWSKQFKTIDTKQAFIPNTIHFGNLYLDQNDLYVWQAIEKKFVSLDAQTGQEKWAISDLDFSFHPPLFYPQRIILTQKNALLSIDRETGNYTKINKQNNWPLMAFKVNGEEQNLLILHEQKLKKISLDFQKITWEIPQIDKPIHQQFKLSEPIIEIKQKQFLAQRHLLTENSDLLLFIDYETGQTIWSKSVSGAINQQVNLENQLITGSDTGQITSFENDGQINWQQQLDGKVLRLLEIQNSLLVIGEKAGFKVELSYFDPNGRLLWQYVPDLLIDAQEVYHDQNNIFLLNTDKNLLEKITIRDQEIKSKEIVNKNFELIFNKDNKDPYVEFKQIETWSSKLKKKITQIKYLSQNIKKIWRFEVKAETKANFLEINIGHDEQLYQNKFLDLEIFAEFSKDGQKQIVKAFYFDHNTWKIRFLPDEPGLYHYQIKIKSPYLRKTIKGEVEIKTYRKEKISIKENQFTINDKQAFLPLGIQDAFFDRNYNGQYFDEMPASTLLEPNLNQVNYTYLPLDEYLDFYQKEASINIFRYGVENWTPPLWNSLNLETFNLSTNGGLFGDQLLTELKNRNLKVIMTIFGFYPPFKSTLEINDRDNQKAIAAYLDYVIARFGPMVDLWEIANEAEPSQAWYDFVTNYLKENDPYQLPISTNWETSHAKNLDFLSVHWYNPIRQNSELISGDINHLVKKHQAQKQAVLISELGFKDRSWFEGANTQMRLMSWLSAMQSMGLIFWTNGQNGIYENKDNANIYLGPTERSYLKALQEFLPQELFVPIKYDSLTLSKEQVQVYTMENQDWFLAYLLKIDPERNQQIYLELDLPLEGELQWYNPADGSIIEEERIKQGQQKITVPDFKLDLALRIKYFAQNDQE